MKNRTKQKSMFLRLLSFVLTAVLLLGIATAFTAADETVEDPEKKLTDIPDDWSHDAIVWCLEQGLMKGTTATLFSPSGATSRAQFVTVLLRMAENFGYNTNGYTAVDTFPDAKAGEWYTKAVAWSNKNAILKGYSDGRFGTNDTLTRQDAATLLYRFIANYLVDDSVAGKTVDLNAKFADAAKIAGYSKTGVSAMCAIGMMNGTGNGFAPTRGLTRAELAKLLMNLYNYVTDNKVLNPFGMMKQGINLYTNDCCATVESTEWQIVTGEGENATVVGSDEGVDTAALMADYYAKGFDHIRLIFAPGYSTEQHNYGSDYYEEGHDNYVKDADGNYHLVLNEDNMENVKNTVAAARAAGLGVVLDMHECYSYPAVIRHADEVIENLRAYLADKDTTEEIRAAGTPVVDAFEAAMTADADTAMDAFLKDEDCAYYWKKFEKVDRSLYEVINTVASSPSYYPEDFGEIWGKVAEALKDLDERVFFQLINERNVNGPEAIVAIDGIRKTGGNNATRMIVLYSYCWEYYTTSGVPRSEDREEWDFGAYQNDKNLMFDIHHYQPYAFVHANNTMTWPTKEGTSRTRTLNELNARLVAAEDLRARTGRKVWIGEYGCYRSVKGYVDYLRDFVASAADKQIPVCVWASNYEKYESAYTGDNFNIHSYRCGYWYPDFLTGVFR